MNPFIQWAQKHGLIATPTTASGPTAAALAPPAPVLHSPAAPPAPVALPMAKEPMNMTDTLTQDATNIVEGAASTAVKAVESVAGTVITKIANGAITLWDDAEAMIDSDAKKVEAALPSSALPGFTATVSAIKQGASDTLSLASSALSTAAPAFTAGLESLADNALGSASNGVALPLVPIVNSGIDDLVNLGVAALQAWGLKAKASLTTT